MTHLVGISVVSEELLAALAAIFVVEHLDHFGVVGDGAHGVRAAGIAPGIGRMIGRLRTRGFPAPQRYARAPARDHHTGPFARVNEATLPAARPPRSPPLSLTAPTRSSSLPAVSLSLLRGRFPCSPPHALASLTQPPLPLFSGALPLCRSLPGHLHASGTVMLLIVTSPFPLRRGFGSARNSISLRYFRLYRLSLPLEDPPTFLLIFDFAISLICPADSKVSLMRAQLAWISSGLQRFSILIKLSVFGRIPFRYDFVSFFFSSCCLFIHFDPLESRRCQKVSAI